MDLHLDVKKWARAAGGLGAVPSLCIDGSRSCTRCADFRRCWARSARPAHPLAAPPAPCAREGAHMRMRAHLTSGCPLSCVLQVHLRSSQPPTAAGAHRTLASSGELLCHCLVTPSPAHPVHATLVRGARPRSGAPPTSSSAVAQPFECPATKLPIGVTSLHVSLQAHCASQVGQAYAAVVTGVRCRRRGVVLVASH